MADVLKNINQIRAFLQDEGYRVSYGKLKADIERGALRPRRGGGFAVGTVNAYAAAHIARREVDESAAADAPLRPAAADGVAVSIAEARVLEDTRMKRIAADRREFEFARERGQYVRTDVLDAELAARAKAFKLGLEKFGTDMAGRVAEAFGGEAKSAQALCDLLELPHDRVPLIVEWAHGNTGSFTRLWLRSVERLLDSYATGTFWTEGMRDAWERWEQNNDAEATYAKPD